MQKELARGSLRNLLGVKEYFFDNNGNVQQGVLGVFAAQMGVPGTKGRRAKLMMMNALMDALRMETGAAITVDEAEKMLERYFPTASDTDDDIKYRLNEFEMRMRNIIAVNNPQWAQENLPAPQWEPIVITLTDADPEGEEQLKKLVPGSYYEVNGQLGRVPPDQWEKWFGRKNRRGEG